MCVFRNSVLAIVVEGTLFGHDKDAQRRCLGCSRLRRPICHRPVIVDDVPHRSCRPFRPISNVPLQPRLLRGHYMQPRGPGNSSSFISHAAPVPRFLIIQPWLCVTLRFPVLAGLKLPEDEIIVVQCKPQDRTVQESKDIGISGAEYVTHALMRND